MKTYSNCPVCNHSQFDNFLECVDYTVSKESFNISVCNNCSFAFTNPIPQDSSIGSYYESEEYISHSNSKKGVVNGIYQLVRNYTISKKIHLLQSLGKGKTLLDIGCGTGEFLNACAQSGFTVHGVEPSETGRKQAHDNFKLIIKDESSIKDFNEKTFDFISLWHVLEHVYHLNDRIQEISRILKDDGYLIIAVPNRNSYDASFYKEHWAAYDLPRHLYHFTPKNIKELFSKHDFFLYKTYPMKFDSYYVSLLSEKYKTGKSNLLKAFFIGFISNWKAKREKTYSSQIYILKKTPK